MINYSTRPLTTEDQPIVWEMLRYAAHEVSVESVQKQPALSIYGANWGKIGDLGIVAEQADFAIGSAWLRLWSKQEQGYGYINQQIPELAIAVLPDYRGQGIGTHLLKNILTMASDRFLGVSLSVRNDNPVVKLYERVGFIKVHNSDILNRTGGQSFKMIYQFKLII